MKNLFRALRRAPKKSAFVAALLMAAVVPAALLAWGPDRPTFTLQNPATYVTFNSITDNKKHGDERNFVQIRNYTDNGKFGENVDLVPGKEYEVYVFYHNNASSNFNSAEHNYKGIARNTKMRVQMPATVNAGASARVTGFVSASNANPAQVWDEAYGKNTSDGAVALRYVPNSAKVTSEGPVNGQAIDLTKLASADGALLGYDALDGNLPGCNPYSGYVTYRFKVDQPNFEITKEVSPAGKNQYTKNLAVKPGDKVDYKIKYKNTGTVTQENVTLKDELPAGVTYVAGTTQYSSSKTNNQWTPVKNDTLTTDGINFGSFAPGGALYVKFSAVVVTNDKLECGNSKLVNTAKVYTENGSKSDDATVTVNKDCKEEPKPKYIEVCRLSDSKYPVRIKENEFDKNKHSMNPKDCEVEDVTTLPETGVADVLTGVMGLGALTTATYYYVASRRQ